MPGPAIFGLAGFFKFFLLYPRYFPRINDSDSIRNPFGEADHQEVSRYRMTDDKLARFYFRMVPIIKYLRQRIVENGTSFGEANPVFPLVHSFFTRVPLEC